MRAVCRAMLMGAAVLAAASTTFTQAPNTSGTVLYEGARLIVGDGSAPIPSGDLLVSNGRIAALGPRGTLKVAPGPQRLDLTGKTIIPAFNNAHLHIGYEGFTNWSAENHTRANVQEHLERTGSPVAESVLARWEELLASGAFVKVMPHDYKRVLREAAGEHVAVAA